MVNKEPPGATEGERILVARMKGEPRGMGTEMGNERSELSVAYVTSVPPTPLCTHWPGPKCPSSSRHFKEEVFCYFIFQHRTHVRQEPDVLSQKPVFAPTAWFLNRRPTVTSKSPPFFAQKSWVGTQHRHFINQSHRPHICSDTHLVSDTTWSSAFMRPVSKRSPLPNWIFLVLMCSVWVTDLLRHHRIPQLPFFFK